MLLARVALVVSKQKPSRQLSFFQTMLVARPEATQALAKQSLAEQAPHLKMLTLYRSRSQALQIASIRSVTQPVESRLVIALDISTTRFCTEEQRLRD